MGWSDLAILIPVLNEAGLLVESINRLSAIPNATLLFCDGGSKDGSVAVLTEAAQSNAKIKLFHKPLHDPSVGRTLNLGFEEAKNYASILILPVDCQLSIEAIDEMKAHLAKNPEIYGGFPKAYRPSSPLLVLYAWLQNLIRTRFGKNLVWTNGIFLGQNTAHQISIPTAGFLEDVILSDSLKEQKAPFVLCKNNIQVDSRRYYPSKSTKRIVINGVIMTAYRLKLASPARLKKIYSKKN